MGDRAEGEVLDILQAAVRSGPIRKILAIYLENLQRTCRSPDFVKPDDFLETIRLATSAGAAEANGKMMLKTLREGAGFDSAMAQRALLYAGQISPYIEGRVLDVGAGDGRVSRAIEEYTGKPIFGMEPVWHEWHQQPKRIVLTSDLAAFLEKAVDTAVLSTVLHHASDPDMLVSMATSIATRRLIVKESVVDARELPAMWAGVGDTMTRQFVSLAHNEQFLYTAFIDWFYNRVLEDNVPVPFNFRPLAHWLTTLRAVGMVSSIELLGIDDELGALYHVLIVVDLPR